MRVGVLVSGGGTNLQAIFDKIESGYLSNCRIVTVVSSNEKAYALKRARKHNIPAICIPRKDYDSVIDYDKALTNHLKSYDVDLVVLAGFMSILGEEFITAFENKIINIHPSLIPSFCGKGYYGLKPHIAVPEYGVKVTEKPSTCGQRNRHRSIILQKPVELTRMIHETLQKRVMEEAEWEILPKAIKLISENRVKIADRKVYID